MSRIKLGFPQVGNYQYPARFLFSKILDCDIVDIPNITQKTIDIGVKYSPNFVCNPFKYTLGTLIETINNGANVLIQLGGGCRYGYYYELQKQIIKDIGYDIKYINLVTEGRSNIFKIFKDLKSIDPSISRLKSLYYLLITIKMVKYMDIMDDYIRSNVGFEVTDGSMENINQSMLDEFLNVKGYFSLRRIFKKRYKEVRSVKLNKGNNITRVGVIGELYTVMEPFSNYYLEKSLAKYNMSVTRYTNATYLLFKKGKFMKHNLSKSRYVKYKMGADSSDNIIRCTYLCENKYDGIIHIKSSFCTPEIASMGIISKICSEYDVPVLFFSFDANTSRVGFDTRIEAFNDMIEMRKK